MTHGRLGWQDYWKHDLQASCIADDPGTAEEIAADWQQWLAGLPDGSRVLDIATGNGIVLSYAAAAARASDRRFVLTGIDLADIDPLRYVTDIDPDLREASFLGGVPAERLPFDANVFDAVTSQYGLEYAAIDRALDEAARVLKPGGALIWLAHSESSEVVRQHRQQAAEFEFLLAARGPIKVMNKLVARQRRHKNLNYSLEMLHACFAEAREYCRQHPPAGIVRQVCSELSGLANRLQARKPDDLEKIMAGAERRLIEHRSRIHSLLAAVMTPARIEQTRARLAEPPWAGLSIAEIRAGPREVPIGTLIRAHLASD